MDNGKNPKPDQSDLEPFLVLGIEKGATYESIQKARDKKLTEVGDDLIARAKIEAAYDSLLMVSLKARQLGEVSSEAITASRKEDFKKTIPLNEKNSLFNQSWTFKFPRFGSSTPSFFPKLELPAREGLTIRIALGILALVLLLVAPISSISTILSLSTIALLISQVRRGRPLFSSFVWSFILLAIGVVIGSIFVGANASLPLHSDSLAKENIQAVPAVVLLWLGTLLLD